MLTLKNQKKKTLSVNVDTFHCNDNDDLHDEDAENIKYNDDVAPSDYRNFIDGSSHKVATTSCSV